MEFFISTTQPLFIDMSGTLPNCIPVEIFVSTVNGFGLQLYTTCRYDKLKSVDAVFVGV